MQQVVLLVGGRSTEHDASVHSFRNLSTALRRSDQISVRATVFIDRQGRRWLHPGLVSSVEELTRPDPASEIPPPGLLELLAGRNVHVFSVLHGSEGEDGAWQGLAEVFDIRGNFGPVAAAALSMDKFAFAAAAAAAFPELSVPRTWAIDTRSPDRGVEAAFAGLRSGACVVKPNSLGASLLTEYIQLPTVGKLMAAIASIEPFDRTALVQEYVSGDEYTVGLFQDVAGCQVLPIARARVPGPLLGYREKHLSNAGVRVGWLDPASDLFKRLASVSERLFSRFDFRLWARFDFIHHEPTDKLHVLEANLMPGLGPGSIYPVMLRRAGRGLESLVAASLGIAAVASPRTKVLEYEIEAHQVTED